MRKKKMRILYIHQYFKTRENSSGIRSYEFAKKLVEQGNEVTMLTRDSKLKTSSGPIRKNIYSKEYMIDGIHVIALKNKYSKYMSDKRRIFSFLSFLMLSSLKSLTLKNYDVVFATSTPLTVGVPAVLVKKIRRKPFVFEVRDLWPEAPIQMGVIKKPITIKLLKALEKKIYKSASHIIALSPGMKEGVLERGINSEKVSMIPNCCDLELFGRVNDKHRFEKKYNLEDHFTAVHPGSMGRANGLEYIVEAARHLKEFKNDRVKILLTGDGQTKPHLESLCEEYGINNIVFTGDVPKTDMPDLLAACNITITTFKNVPILSTNSPNKFFDSLAAGKPVIVNSAGWTKDIVEENGIGYYVEPDDPKQLAALLDKKSKIGNDETLQNMGAKARKLAETKYDRNELALQVNSVLQRSVLEG